MTAASAAVIIPQLPAVVPISFLGSKWQSSGFSITPSFTPSIASHSATAAAVAACSLQAGTGSAVHHGRAPDRLHHQLGPVDRRSARDDAVIIFRIALRFH